MGLNLVTVPATPRLPLKRSNAQGTFPSTLRVNIVLRELWPHPVETTHVLYPHHQFGAQKGLSNISKYRSACTVTVAPPSSKKYGPITPKSATAHQRVTREEWSRCYWSSRGLRSKKKKKFCLFMTPLIWK
jgi:hypothetical protein